MSILFWKIYLKIIIMINNFGQKKFHSDFSSVDFIFG